VRCRDMIFDVEEFVSETVFFCCIFSQTLFCRIFLETGMWKSLIFFALYMFFWKCFFLPYLIFSVWKRGGWFFLLCFFFAVGRGDADDSCRDFFRVDR